MKKSFVLACLGALLVSVAHAEVSVSDPWSRATVAQQRASGAFMTLTAERDMKLVEVQSGAANVVEIHEMRMDGEVMRMRAIDALELPAGTPVELKPGGYHVMLLDLVEPLVEGNEIELHLVFEDAEGTRSEQAVSAEVRSLTHRHGDAGGHAHEHAGQHGHHAEGEQCHHHEAEGKHEASGDDGHHHHGHHRH